jgi:hypothetical protein
MAEHLLNLMGTASSSRAVHPFMSLAQIDERQHFLERNTIEHSTEKGYLTGFKDYASFCFNHNLSLRPTALTQARYIAYTSQFIASAPKYLSGARHFLKDIYPGEFEQNCASPLVQTTIKGSKKIRADPIHRKNPLSTSHLATLSNLYDDLLFAAIISCGFYGCHRIGELVWSNQKTLQDWRKIIKRGSLHFSDSRASYFLPYHKGDRFYHGSSIIFTRQQITDPVVLLQRYCQERTQRLDSTS